MVAVGEKSFVFEIGDSAIYPAHGLTVIKKIEEKEVGGKKKTFYVLQVVENQMTILVPTDNVKAVGLRKVISRKEADRVYDLLKRRDVRIDQTTWNRRSREYMDKIRTGSIFEIAEVMRNLFLLRHSKELSFGEKKMLDQAKQLLVRELSVVKHAQEDMVEKEIQSFFS